MIASSTATGRSSARPPKTAINHEAASTASNVAPPSPATAIGAQSLRVRRAAVAVVLLCLDQHRDDDAGQDAAEQQLVDDVRQRVGQPVRVADAVQADPGRPERHVAQKPVALLARPSDCHVRLLADKVGACDSASATTARSAPSATIAAESSWAAESASGTGRAASVDTGADRDRPARSTVQQIRWEPSGRLRSRRLARAHRLEPASEIRRSGGCSNPPNRRRCRIESCHRR